MNNVVYGQLSLFYVAHQGKQNTEIEDVLRELAGSGKPIDIRDKQSPGART